MDDLTLVYVTIVRISRVLIVEDVKAVAEGTAGYQLDI